MGKLIQKATNLTFALVLAVGVSTGLFLATPQKASALSNLKWYSCVGNSPKNYYIVWSALSSEDTYLKVQNVSGFVAFSNNHQGNVYYLSNNKPVSVTSITNNGTQTTKNFGSKITSIQWNCLGL